MSSKYKKYKNPDKRCTLPFEPSPLGYCWYYADRVDTGKQQKEIIEECRECEYWEDHQKLSG